MQYKGFTIKKNENFLINYKPTYDVCTTAGSVRNCDTIDEAKGWINDNPIENFSAIMAGGSEFSKAYWDGDVSEMARVIARGDGELFVRQFRSKEAAKAYWQGVDDADGWVKKTSLNYSEYVKIRKKLQNSGSDD